VKPGATIVLFSDGIGIAHRKHARHCFRAMVRSVELGFTLGRFNFFDRSAGPAEVQSRSSTKAQSGIAGA